MVVNKDQNMEKAILDAAERLFLAKGFAMVSTTQIAKEVGCNQALVHYYFRTKERLFDEIFAQKLKTFFSVIFKTHDADLPFEEKLRRTIAAHFDMLQANPKLPFLVINELTTNPDRIDHLKASLGQTVDLDHSPFQQELNAEIEAGRIRPTTIPDIIYMMVSLNAMAFIAAPIMKKILYFNEVFFEQMLQHRKQENIRVILNSLKPDVDENKLNQQKTKKK